MEQFARSELLLGKGSTEILQNSTVAVFGLGGVGSYAAEALARAGIGHLVLVDADTVSESNLNRQLYALRSTVGRKKTDAARERIADISEMTAVDTRDVFFDASNADTFDFSSFDYVVDAIDTVSSKILLAVKCREAGTPMISCMGTGNKLDPTRFIVTDLAKTDTCPLARVMRRELKKHGITHLDVVYSTEPPLSAAVEDGSRHAPGSVPFVPPVAGFIAAGDVIKKILQKPLDSSEKM